MTDDEIDAQEQAEHHTEFHLSTMTGEEVCEEPQDCPCMCRSCIEAYRRYLTWSAAQE